MLSVGQESTLRSALRRSRLRAILISSGGPFNEARFLPDGQHLATVGEGDGLAIWDIRTGSRVRAMMGSETHLEHLVVEPDGRYAATAGDDGIVEVWDLESGTRVHLIDEHFDPVNDLALSPDGLLFASASDDGSVRVWDMVTGAQKQAIFDEVGAVTAVAFTHDGKALATSGQEQRIILWDLNTGARIRTLFRNESASKLGTRIAFNSKGTLFAAARWNETLLWDPITGKQEGSLTHTNKVTSFAFSPSGRLLASVGYDGELKVWDARRRVELYSIAEEPALRLLSSSTSRSSIADSGWLQQVEFSSDGQQLMTIGIDGTVKVWSCANGEEDTAFLAHEGWIHDVIFSTDGHFMASSGSDGTAAIWDWQKRALLFRTPATATRLAPQIDFHPQTNTLVVAADTTLSFWNAGTHARTGPDLSITGDGRQPESITPSNLAIERVRYFHRQNRIVVGAGRSALIFDLTKPSGTSPKVLQANADIYAVAVSPDDRTIAFNCRENPDGGNLAICLWDAESGEVKTKVSDASSGPVFKLVDIAFSADGRWLVTADAYRSVQVWDLHRHALDRVLVGHRESVTGVSVSHDGNRIATTGDDWMRIWDRTRSSPLNGFPDAEPGGWRTSFSPDDKHVAVGGADGFIRIYPMDTAELVPLATERLPLALTDGDCQHYESVPCTSRKTPLQLANAARVELRNGNWSSGMALMQQAQKLAPTAGFGLDLWRFEAHSLLTQGQDAIREPMRHALAALPANPAKDRQRNRVRFQADLEQALLAGMTASMLSLDQVPIVDPSLLFDPKSFASSVATSQLLDFARGTATRGRDGFALELLHLAPGVTNTDWAERAAGALVKSAVMRAAVEDDEHEDWAKALERLASVDVLTTDPRYDAYLRLKIKLGGKLDNLDSATHQHAMARRNTDTLLALAKAGIASNKAVIALRLALTLEPSNDDVRYELALREYVSKNTLDALAHLKDVAPTARVYARAMQLAGSIVHDDLHEPTQAFYLLARSINSESDDWANFAEAALAANRLNEARLIAQRVTNGYDLGACSASTELAMRFVIVSALTQGGEFTSGDRELATLIALAENISQNSDWKYVGTKTAISRITRPALRLFESKLVDYVEKAPHNEARRGNELRSLLGKVAQEWASSH
jgi:WD40 repeat protein